MGEDIFKGSKEGMYGIQLDGEKTEVESRVGNKEHNHVLI